MKYFIYTLIFFGFGFVSHNTPMAFFELTVLENAIQVEIEFEQEALETSIQSKYADKQSEELIQVYLNKHTQWTVNDAETILKIQSIEKNRGHINISAQLAITDEVKTIGIENTCLVDAVEGHYNIIRLKQQDRLREFGLNKERTFTEILVD